jgi:hypothetical protein
MAQEGEKDYPVLGKDIPWTSFEYEALRVTNFTPLAIIENSKIKDVSVSLPYAMLLVESPKLPQESRLLVVNKVDFQNLWAVYKERGVNPEEEVIVFCVPFYRNKLLRLFNSSMPRLHIYIFPKGRLEQVYDSDFKPKDAGAWLTPIAEYIPKHYKY